MTTPLDGPRRRPASGGPATALVVLLHGYGADGQDLIGLADVLAPVLPDAAFAAPNAPTMLPMGPGRQWFAPRSESAHFIISAAGPDAASVPLAGFIEAELASLGLAPGRLALFGFSQGAMLALHIGLRLAPAPAAIVSCSGLLVAPERLAAECRGAPPVLLVHGTADPVIPFECQGEAAAALRRQGIAVETVVRPGLGHGIDEPALAAAGRFLRQHLATAQPQG